MFTRAGVEGLLKTDIQACIWDLCNTYAILKNFQLLAKFAYTGQPADITKNNTRDNSAHGNS